MFLHRDPLFTCMFSGMSIVWDRRFGFPDELRASPIERGVIPTSRVLAAVIRALISAVIGDLTHFHIHPRVGRVDVLQQLQRLGPVLDVPGPVAPVVGFRSGVHNNGIAHQKPGGTVRLIGIWSTFTCVRLQRLFPIDGMPEWYVPSPRPTRSPGARTRSGTSPSTCQAYSR